MGVYVLRINGQLFQSQRIRWSLSDLSEQIVIGTNGIEGPSLFH